MVAIRFTFKSSLSNTIRLVYLTAQKEDLKNKKIKTITTFAKNELTVAEKVTQILSLRRKLCAVGYALHTIGSGLHLTEDRVFWRS